MSIKPVRAARITDTTGALLGASRVRRRPRNTVKNDVFHIMRNHAGRKNINKIKICQKSVDRIRPGVYRGSNKRQGARAYITFGYQPGLRQGNVRVAGARIYDTYA